MLRLLGEELSYRIIAGVAEPSFSLVLNSKRNTAVSPGMTGCSGTRRTVQSQVVSVPRIRYGAAPVFVTRKESRRGVPSGIF